MKLLALRVDHRSAPTSVRETLAFDGPRRDEGLHSLRERFPPCEFVVLSTCNRVEIYAAAESPESLPAVESLTGWLAEFHRVESPAFAPHLVAHHDDAAVGHLFRVASSLESLALGEGQILGQVRDAYEGAKSAGAVGPILHAVFQNAIRVGKKVRAETGLDQGRVSIASVALDVAREVFDSFGDKTILIIGAGKMADQTLQHLKSLKPGAIVVANRDFERGAKAAARWGGRAVPFDRLGQALTEADVVVSTTASERPIVSREMFARVQRARRNRLILILDIAVPRDFEPEVGNLDQVMLYNVDDLQEQVERNLQGRKTQVEPARAIIDREALACLTQLRHQKHAGALLRQLGDYADAVRIREQDALYAKLSHLSPADREAIALTLHRLQNQFLHHPRTALKSAAATGPGEQPHPLLQAVRDMYGLPDDRGHRP